MRTLLLLLGAVCSMACQTSPAPGDAGPVAPEGSAPAIASQAASASPEADKTLAATSSSTDAPPLGPRHVGADLLMHPSFDPAPVQGCPHEMAKLGPFCIDRWEAHLVRVEDGVDVPHPYPEVPKDATLVARSSPAVYPQPYISQELAEKACNNAGKRLCRRREWLRACRGGPHRRYPYGHSGQRGVCNTAKDHLMSMFFGEDSGKWKYEEHFNSPLMAIAPGFLARTGSHEGCTTPEGVYDLVGNLHEWVDDEVDQDLVDELDEENVERHKQPYQIGNGIFLGGFFSNTSELGPGCLYITIAHEPRYHDYSTGFRCCMNAYPESVSDTGD